MGIIFCARRKGLPNTLAMAFFGGSLICGAVEAYLWHHGRVTAYVTLAWGGCVLFLLMPSLALAKRLKPSFCARVAYCVAVAALLGSMTFPDASPNPGITHMIICISCGLITLQAKPSFVTHALLLAFGVDVLLYSIPVSWWYLIIPEWAQIIRNVIWLVAMGGVITSGSQSGRKRPKPVPSGN